MKYKIPLFDSLKIYLEDSRLQEPFHLVEIEVPERKNHYALHLNAIDLKMIGIGFLEIAEKIHKKDQEWINKKSNFDQTE